MYSNKRSNLQSVILEVLADMYKNIRENNNKVFVGFQSCRVFDVINVKRCVNCKLSLKWLQYLEVTPKWPLSTRTDWTLDRLEPPYCSTPKDTRPLDVSPNTRHTHENPLNFRDVAIITSNSLIIHLTMIQLLNTRMRVKLAKCYNLRLLITTSCCAGWN